MAAFADSLTVWATWEMPAEWMNPWAVYVELVLCVCVCVCFIMAWKKNTYIIYGSALKKVLLDQEKQK